MINKTYTIGLNTPAFLGNASQHAQFRTPPIKSLIRRWWRVLKAKEFDYDYKKIRETEGRIFGHTDLEHGSNKWAMKSQFRLVLKNWKKGANHHWDSKQFGEVAGSTGSRAVNSAVYTGFGAIDFKTKSPYKPWLKENTETELVVQSRSTDLDEAEIEKLFYLINWFGAIGSRSSNGWGSLEIKNLKFNDHQLLLDQISRPIECCLNNEWSNAIGVSGGRKTVWETSEFIRYEEVIKKLAEIMAGIRMLAKDLSQMERNSKQFSYIHLLGLPASGHWKLSKDERWPSQIKMKVYKTVNNKYQGVIYHFPQDIPRVIRKSLSIESTWSAGQQQEFWLKVHKFISSNTEAQL